MANPVKNQGGKYQRGQVFFFYMRSKMARRKHHYRLVFYRVSSEIFVIFKQIYILNHTFKN